MLTKIIKKKNGNAIKNILDLSQEKLFIWKQKTKKNNITEKIKQLIINGPKG